MLAPCDEILFFVGKVDIDYDRPCLSTAASDPIFDAIAGQERGTLEDIVIWTQSCKDTVQQRPSNALMTENWMHRELKFNAAVVDGLLISEVGSDSEADNIFLLLSNDISLVPARLLSHVDSNNKGILLIFSLL